MESAQSPYIQGIWMHMPRNGFRKLDYTSFCRSLHDRTMELLELLPNCLAGINVSLRIQEKKDKQEEAKAKADLLLEQ